jgi:hypothetical protein
MIRIITASAEPRTNGGQASASRPSNRSLSFPDRCSPVAVVVHERPAASLQIRRMRKSRVMIGGQSFVPALRSRYLRITVSTHNRARGRKVRRSCLDAVLLFFLEGQALGPTPVCRGLADRPLETDRCICGRSCRVLSSARLRRSPVGVRGSLSRLQCDDRLSRQVL